MSSIDSPTLSPLQHYRVFLGMPNPAPSSIGQLPIGVGQFGFGSYLITFWSGTIVIENSDILPIVMRILGLSLMSGLIRAVNL